MHRAAAAVALALIPASPALAECWPKRPVLPAPDAKAPLAARIERLRQHALWTEDGEDTDAWRALLGEARSAKPASSETIANVEALLSRELSGRGTGAEQLSLATDAMQRMQAAGQLDSPAGVRVLTAYVFKEAQEGRADRADPLVEPLLASARKHFGETSFEWGEANSAAATLRYQQGRYDKAVPHGQAWLAALHQCMPPDYYRTTNAQVNLAIMLSMAGRLDEALAQHFAAADWLGRYRPDDHVEMVHSLSALGMVLRNVSRLGEAEAVLRRTVDLQAEYLPERYADRAQSLGALANVLAAQGKREAADGIYAASIDMAAREKDAGSVLGASGSYRRWADLAQSRGDFALAMERREAALAQMGRAAKDHPEVARATIEAASTMLLLGRSAEAAARAAPAIETLRRRMPVSDGRRLGMEVAWARIVAYDKGPEAGHAALAEPARMIEELMLDPRTQRGDLVNYAPLLGGGATLQGKLALQTGRLDEAFRAFQLAGLSKIVSVMHDNALRAATRDPEELALVVRLQDAIRDRRALERDRTYLVAQASLAADLPAVQARLAEVDRTIADTSAELDRRYPDFRLSARPAPVDFAQFRATMAKDEVLLMPLVLEDGTYTIAATREGLTWAKGALNQFDAANLIDRLRGSIDAANLGEDRPFDLAASRSLYDGLIPAPLRPLLAKHRSLLWFASGRLAAVPPALLAAPESAARTPRWLARSHAITVLPALRRTPRDAGESRPFDFLGVGAPDLGNPAPARERGLALGAATVETGALAALPALPTARRELDAMRGALGGGEASVLAGSAATKARLLGQPLDKAGVIAFATHALDAGALPGLTEPALVLTPSGNGSADGVLTASEIAGLKLKADWVILSACNTASGGGEGEFQYAGLASAFVDAGARALLVSHWPVRDDAAARLTVATVRGARSGLPRAEALRRAMVALMDDRTVPGSANPAVWAPFVLVER